MKKLLGEISWDLMPFQDVIDVDNKKIKGNFLSYKCHNRYKQFQEVFDMTMAELVELEKKIMKYMDVVVEDEVIDVNEIVNLAKYANDIVKNIDEDKIITGEEQVVYDRVSAKLKTLFQKYEIEEG